MPPDLRPAALYITIVKMTDAANGDGGWRCLGKGQIYAGGVGFQRSKAGAARQHLLPLAQVAVKLEDQCTDRPNGRGFNQVAKAGAKGK